MPGFDKLKDLDEFIGQVGPSIHKVRFHRWAVECPKERS